MRGTVLRHAKHYLAVLARIDAVFPGDPQQAVLSFEDDSASIMSAMERVQALYESSNADSDAARLISDYVNAGRQMLSRVLGRDEHLKIVRTALSAAHTLGDLPAEAAHWGRAGLDFAALGMPERALQCHEEHERLAQEIGDLRGQATACVNSGLALADLGHFREAIAKYEHARTRFLELDDPAGAANCLANKGIALKNSRDLESARSCLEQALADIQLCNRAYEKARIVANLANVYSSLGEYDRAIDLHLRSLQLNRESHDAHGEALDMTNLGIAFISAGRGALEAAAILSDAIFRLVQCGDLKSAARSVHAFGVALEIGGKLDRAIVAYQDAAERYVALGDRPREARSRHYHAEVLNKAGDVHEAIVQLRRAAEIYAEFDGDTATVLQRAAERWSTTPV